MPGSQAPVDDVATLRMQVERLIARCVAKDVEFAKERAVRDAELKRLRAELKTLRQEARHAA